MKLFRYILFVIAVVSLQSGLAQRSDYQPEFTVGVKGGTTLSRVSFTPTVTQSLLLGYTGGVSVRYIEEKFFGLIAEINFTQCGWNETFEEDPYTYTHTLNYVTIPFLTHFFFGNRVVRGFVNAGPQIGLLLGDSYKSNFDIYIGRPILLWIGRYIQKQEERCIRGFPQPNNNGITGIFISLLIKSVHYFKNQFFKQVSVVTRSS